MVLTIAPVSYAYGHENYQATFSGNCNNTTLCNGHFGFWGWCSFGPWTGTLATSGSDADCQYSFYSHSQIPAFNSPTVHTSVMGTAWDVEQSAFGPFMDFFVTAGSVTFSGPTVVQALAAGFGAVLISAGCTISGQTVTCPIPVAEGFGIYNPDTGIIFQLGHSQLQDCSAFFGPSAAGITGCHYDQQVNQIP